MTLLAAAPPLVAPTTAPLTGDQALAASGRMGITDLMERAQGQAQQGRVREAAELYALWIAHTQSSHHHIACFNMGTLLASINDHPGAESAYRQALAYSPGMLQAQLNLGHELERQKREDDALATWASVIERCEASPQPLELHLHALNNRARLLEQLKRYEESEATMVKSLQLDATQPSVIQHYVHIRQKQCEWPVYQPVGQVTVNQLLMNTSALAMLSATDDPALQLLAAHKFAKDRIGEIKPIARPARPPVQDIGPAGPSQGAELPSGGDAAGVLGRKIRIGYLSGDLCLHAVGMLTVELLELHDRERMEVFGFCWSRNDGTALQGRLRQAMDHHVPIGALTDEAAAQLIAAHHIDVLIDLQGLTSGARPGILARRPAPVQASYLGLPATSGIPGVDYILADRYVLPEAMQPYYTEQPIYLPHCYQSSDRQRPVGPLPTRAQYGLPEDAFVYGAFNNNFKFTAEVFQGWMRMLAAVPNSVLWLLADNRWSKENMLREADAAGVARARLIFAPRVMPAEYLARMQLIDLFLDTFPYNAGTTANDVLWMGTPLLTRSGRSYISRMAGSLLTQVGLPDLITETADEYEAKAIQLGRQPQRVASYRRYLQEHGRQSALFDMPRFVQAYEDALCQTLAHHLTRPAA
ncbi:MAG: tetratricopeptide repeat protein [Burkholderiales bacterium]